MDLALIEKICQRYDLGTMECQPRKLTGGYLHKMYSLFTTKGKYTVKLLNPYIMQKENIMENYRVAEKLEFLLEEKGIPIVAALVFENRKMQSIEGQFFYLYEWYDGKALQDGEVEKSHCRKIGNLLAQIHEADRRGEPYLRSEIHVDWDFYIEQLSTKNTELYQLMKENRSLLYESQENGNIAVKKLPEIVTVCHNDMDRRNVLWAGNDCRIIDLECLSYSSPLIELYETALWWSGYDKGHVDYGLFCSFLDSYGEAGGHLPTDWENLYWSNYSRLEWLEYSLKRALGIRCTAEETEIGISEVKNTIAQVICYHNEKDNIIRHRF